MTGPQITSFAVLGAMMALFIWGRLRYDLVAILALLAAIVTGIVKPKEAFSGFSDDIVIIVASALVVSGAVARSGIIEIGLDFAETRVKRVRSQLLVLVGSVTLLSAIVKNIGALAMLIPAAFQMARKSKASPSVFLMPMSFGSLLGGLITLVGTSPNIIVSRVREEMVGKPFGMFDYTPVGLGLAAAGVLFLRFGYRLLPRDRTPVATMGEAIDIKDYVTEARVLATSAVMGQTVADFSTGHEDVQVTGILRGAARMALDMPEAVLQEDDVLLLEGDPEALERAIARSGLQLTGQGPGDDDGEASSDDVGVIEAVVAPNSLLVGQAAGRMSLREHFGIKLIAISRADRRLTDALGDTILEGGDVVVMQGPLDKLPGRLAELGCLPLAQRTLRLGSVRRGLLPIGILLGAMALTATGVVPVAVAFFGAATLVLLTGALPIRDAYTQIEWPILVMLGALIPVSDSLRTTGGTDLIAHWLQGVAATLPPWGAVGLILVAAMAVTPFLNNAATVLVMAPIAATFANDLGYRPDAFLMAVAVGAGSDFLTPIGHQCNTLVMGPGGYRFADYARLGAPLSLMVIVVGVPLILAVWPLH